MWDDGYPSGGNYWSDYTGTDANLDGIGDTPYIIDTNNTDHYPFMSQSGWKKAKLGFLFTPNPAFAGQSVTMLGSLTDYAGNPIGNTKVDVYVNNAFSGNLLTNASGWFKATATVSASGTYSISVIYAGSKSHNPSNHTETLAVYQKINTKVMFSLTPNPAVVGQTVALKGNLTDASGNPIGNAPVEVYLKVGAGPWQYMAKLTTSSLGVFQAASTVNTAGTYQIAVVYRGSYKYNQSYNIGTLVVNSTL
jgi:protocatechuate 3,4-dioxygenase beta subunit